ncbi:unnamed protein product [Peniophora sp. CBMAI 1063]|nr:unnamed protein product [Peniophora sp. CBMAI 1063]
MAEIIPNVPPADDEKNHVDHLPAELLATIFKFTAYSLKLGDYPNRGGHPWIYLSHVCRRWRTVSLACQELWSMNLPRANDRWTAICLSRAPSMLLDVVLEYTYMYRGKAYHKAGLVVISQWPRIKTLRVDLICELVADESSIGEAAQDTLDELFSKLSAPNPDLEELVLFLNTAKHDVPWFPVRLPPNVCSSQQLPRLREVELRNCVLPHSSAHWPPFPSGLRVLKLVNTQAWDDTDFMIQILQELPLLEVLEHRFDNHHKAENVRCTPSLAHQSRCVSLPRLQNLILEDCWLQNTIMFHHLAAPSSCNLTIHRSVWDSLHVPDTAEDALQTYISTARESLVQHFASASSQQVVFDYVRLDDIEIFASSVPNGSHSGHAGLLPSELMISIPDTDDEDEHNPLLHAYFSHPVFTKTSRLGFSREIWSFYRDRYEEYTNVRQIVLLYPSDVDAFTSALREKGAALFPMLSSVVVEPYVKDTDQAGDLVDALCNAHAASEQFESLEIPARLFHEDFLSELRAKIGTHRLKERSM